MKEIIDKPYSKLSAGDKRRIRNALGVRSIRSLIKKARDKGALKGKVSKQNEKKAWMYGIKLYNKQVEKEIQQQQALKRDKNYSRTFLKKTQDLLDHGKQFYVNKQQFPRLRRILGDFYNSDKRKSRAAIMIAGGQHYTLNDNTLGRLTTNLNELWYDEGSDYQSSDSMLIHNLKYFNRITFKSINSDNEPLFLIDGAFFKYLHQTKLDLSTLQIYSDFDKDHYKNNCFVHALIEHGVPEKITNDIKLMIKTRDLPQKKIDEIAIKHGLYITVRRPESARNLRHYPVSKSKRPDVEPIELGLIDGHYFLIKPIEVTSNALEHYEEVKDLNRWNEIITKPGQPIVRKKRFIDSYKVVQLLLDNKETLLKELERTDDILSTQYYHKCEESDSLEFNESNLKMNEYKPKKQEKFINVFLDFETNTTGDCHTPYLAEVYQEKVNFKGEESGRKLLDHMCRKYKYQNLKLIAHNAKYDLTFIFKYLKNINLIGRGTMLLRAWAVYYCDGKRVLIQVQDSYAMIAMKLKKFQDTFDLEADKELLPYDMYNDENINKKWLTPLECKVFCETQCQKENIGVDVDEEMVNKYFGEFMANCDKWDCIDGDGRVNIIKYSAMYCQMDTRVLAEGYEKFKKWMSEITDGLNIDDYVSLPSLADDYLRKEGCYDGVYAVGGIVRAFLQKCVVGGRCMTRENKTWHVLGLSADLDATSLYPSAQDELGGYLMGKPKVLTTMDYEVLKTYDSYFVQIRITKVNKHRKFPLMSKKVDGIRNFSNYMEGEVVHIGKIGLEDAIEFQGIEFEIIKGYYYDEGRNPEIKRVVNHLFTKRLEKKNEGNPIEKVYKLMLNVGYGKSCQKPFEEEVVYIKNKEKDDYVTRNYNYIKSMEQLPNFTWKIKKYAAINDHFNNVACGIEILEMSKRIMNRVMCLAEDLGIPIFYQDTDSMHLPYEDVEKLAEFYQEEYGKVLLGKQMGQFNTDFESKKIGKREIVASESYFLWKKSYYDELRSLEKVDGEFIYDDHIRMKGINHGGIIHEAVVNFHGSVKGVYKHLYEKNEIKFDMTAGGAVPVFHRADEMTITTQNEGDKHTTRTVKFLKQERMEYDIEKRLETCIHIE